MLNAVRSAKALQLQQHPSSISSLFSYSHLSNHIISPSAGIRLFAQAVSSPKQPHSSSDESMDPKQEGPESKTRDTMSSFGEGYATRADEEGFGGTYGGNQYLHEDTEDKNVRGKDPAATEFDHSQGSKVKEKEKAGNQTKLPS